jgi:hypothetical protein
MSSWDYRDIFKAIVVTQGLPDYIHDIAVVLSEIGFDKKAIGEALRKNGISTVKNIEEDLLDLLLAYLNIILDDHCISENEYKDFGLLKIFFKIREGAFYHKRYYQIRSIINSQMEYLSEDEILNPDKATFTVHLQDLFDLGYDEFQTLIADINLISYQNRNEIPPKMKINFPSESSHSGELDAI